MKPRTHKQDSLAIVYDADLVPQPGPLLFDPRYWEAQDAVVGRATGRGSALFLDTPFGPAVLREYLRGGWPARVSRDRYFFSGYERSRPLAEFGMLERLTRAGLPVPEPLAALCRREGLFCRGSLLMRRIAGVTPLADLLEQGGGDAGLWRAAGACIRRFHDAGVVHADLNARNILLGRDGTVYLIDFDRARIRPGDSRAFRSNLGRLRRSLEKFSPPGGERLENGWQELLDAYAGAEDTA